MPRAANHKASPAKRAKLAQFVRRNAWAVGVVGVVLALAGPSASANDGDPVIAGQVTTADTSTSVSTSQGIAFVGSSHDPSSNYVGVEGDDTGGGDGVAGFSGRRNGVFGFSSSDTASGVYGENDSGGFGVAGRAAGGGVGVLADTSDATSVALRMTGELQFQNRSGIVTVASGHKSVKVTLPGVTSASMVTATVQQTGGFFVRAAVPAAGTFTIYLNKAPTSPAKVKVAYLVLN